MRSVAWVLGGTAAAGLLTGCGGTWQKAGARAAEFDRDWAPGARQANSRPGIL